MATPDLTISDLTSGYALDSSPGIGVFQLGIFCTACGGGFSGNTLSFDVTSPTGFNVDDFTHNDLMFHGGAGLFFASDIISPSTGSTAIIGANGLPPPPPVVAEPSPCVFLFVGFSLVVWAAQLFKRKSLAG